MRRAAVGVSRLVQTLLRLLSTKEIIVNAITVTPMEELSKLYCNSMCTCMYETCGC